MDQCVTRRPTGELPKREPQPVVPQHKPLPVETLKRVFDKLRRLP